MPSMPLKMARGTRQAMRLFQDIQENESQYESFVMPEHPFEDCRGCAELEMDQWPSEGNHLLNSVLFTLPEIVSLFPIRL